MSAFDSLCQTSEFERWFDLTSEFAPEAVADRKPIPAFLKACDWLLQSYIDSEGVAEPHNVEQAYCMLKIAAQYRTDVSWCIESHRRPDNQVLMLGMFDLPVIGDIQLMLQEDFDDLAISLSNQHWPENDVRQFMNVTFPFTMKPIINSDEVHTSVAEDRQGLYERCKLEFPNPPGSGQGLLPAMRVTHTRPICDELLDPMHMKWVQSLRIRTWEDYNAAVVAEVEQFGGSIQSDLVTQVTSTHYLTRNGISLPHHGCFVLMDFPVLPHGVSYQARLMHLGRTFYVAVDRPYPLEKKNENHLQRLLRRMIQNIHLSWDDVDREFLDLVNMRHPDGEPMYNLRIDRTWPLHVQMHSFIKAHWRYFAANSPAYFLDCGPHWPESSFAYFISSHISLAFERSRNLQLVASRHSLDDEHTNDPMRLSGSDYVHHCYAMAWLSGRRFHIQLYLERRPIKFSNFPIGLLEASETRVETVTIRKRKKTDQPL